MTFDEIIDGCRSQNRRAQAELHSLFFAYAMSVARRYTSGSQVAEEVVNDAFFKVFTKIDRFSGEQPFRFWLRRIVINTAIDRYRSRMNRPKETEFQPWHESSDDLGLEAQLTQEQILGSLDRLPPAYRTCFSLFVVDGFSHDEIGEMLGITSGGSKSNVSRARQHLRSLFSQDFGFLKK